MFSSKTLTTIKKAIRITIQVRPSQVVLESDSQMTINIITGRRQTTKLNFRDLIRDIKNLATCIKNIQNDSKKTTFFIVWRK